jgi:hypothetical protein
MRRDEERAEEGGERRPVPNQDDGTGFDFGRAPWIGAISGALLGLIATALERNPDGPLSVLAGGPLPGQLEIVLAGAAAGYLAGLIAALGWIGE